MVRPGLLEAVQRQLDAAIMRIIEQHRAEVLALRLEIAELRAQLNKTEEEGTWP